MQTIPWNEIENATADDVGKICLGALGCNPLAIEDTLDECCRVAAACTGEDFCAAHIDDHTDLFYLNSESLVAVEVGPAETTED